MWVPAGSVELVVAVEVIVVPKLPDRISAADALFGIVSVPAVAVMMRPLTEVAVAAPMFGVVNTALVAVMTPVVEIVTWLLVPNLALSAPSAHLFVIVTLVEATGSCRYRPK